MAFFVVVFVVVVFRCNGVLEIQFILDTVYPTAVCSPVVGGLFRVFTITTKQTVSEHSSLLGKTWAP